MSRVFFLSRLQSIDLELDDLTKRLAQMERRLAEDPVLAELRSGLTSEEKRLGELRATLHDGELEAKTMDTKIRQLEQRLYGGSVNNPGELDGMEKSLAMHRRQRSALDDRLLELMDAVEKTQASVHEKRARLQEAESARSQEIEHLRQEQKSALSRQSGLTVQRDQILSEVDETTLKTYRQLKRAKGGRAIAQVRHDACSVCGMAVPSGHMNRIQAGDEIVICSGCGRILAA